MKNAWKLAVASLGGALLFACVGAEPGPDPSGASLPTPASSDEDSIVDVVVPDNEDQPLASPAEKEGVLAATTPPVKLYLNGDGATIARGRNDSVAHTSSIVQGTTTFPASSYRGDPARWAKIVSTVRSHYARYNVEVVDSRPATAPYLEAVVTSGSPSLIGYGDSLGGIAPSRCGVISSSVVFVFDRRLRGEVQVGEVASHELAHSLSLSHTPTPTDLMSYSGQTPLVFSDLDAACGPLPNRAEPCNCGGSTQNNHQQLLKYVGPTAGGTSPPPTTPPPTTPPPTTPPTSASIAIVAPANGTVYAAGQRLDVRADLSKVTGIQSVVLKWQIGSTVYDYACPSSYCSVSGSAYTWRLVPGGGERIFFVRATTSGGAVDSPTHRIDSNAAPPLPPPPPPATDGGTASTGEVQQFCVDEINRYRATVGAPALARWTSAEVCTANECENDQVSRTAHGSFGACGEWAQNECPGWMGWSGDPKAVIKQCLAMMWGEGPGGGHYENMRSARYTRAACNFFKASSNQVTAIQNFR